MQIYAGILRDGTYKVSSNISLNNDCYFLPHHCVLRPENTTNLRVVFDVSCKTTSNISLNDILHTGPRIQEDLFILMSLANEDKPVSWRVRSNKKWFLYERFNEEIKRLRENITKILLEFGMPLRKWSSNNKFILENIDENKIESNFKIETDDCNVVKALGVIRNPQADKISLKCNMEKCNTDKM